MVTEDAASDDAITVEIVSVEPRSSDAGETEVRCEMVIRISSPNPVLHERGLTISPIFAVSDGDSLATIEEAAIRLAHVVVSRLGGFSADDFVRAKIRV